MGFIFAAVCLIVIFWSYNRYKIRQHVNLANIVKSNKWHTLLCWGKIFKTEDMIPYMVEYGKKYGPNCVLWMGPIPLFYSTDPQILKEILTSKNCLQKPEIIYNGISSVGGEGLLTQNDEAWAQHRKLLNKGFSYNVLISFLSIFRNGINHSIEEIQETMKKGELVNMLTIFRKLTMENASRTVLQRNLHHSKFDVTDLTHEFNGILEYIFAICSYQYLRVGFLRKLADIFLYRMNKKYIQHFFDVINESLFVAEKNDTTDPSYVPEMKSIVNVLLDGIQQNAIKPHEAKGAVMHILAGAFDTTSTTMYLALVLLAMNPEYQERAYEEVISVLPDDDIEIAIQHLDQLVFLEMVISETQRLFPAAPHVFRRVANEKVSLSNGLTLPVGQIICIDLYGLQRNTDLWGPNANAFNPENFLASNFSERHPFSYMPFTKGLRSCIGIKYAMLGAKMSLAQLIKCYKFSTDFKYENLVAENHITIKLEKEAQLYLEPRIKNVKGIC